MNDVNVYINVCVCEFNKSITKQGLLNKLYR